MVGAVLDRRYRIESKIARGGMSIVYRGTDLRLDRPVAVKVMDPQFAEDPQFLARFEFEARSVARLNHPGLVAVYDQGHDGDHVFLVMELVEGGTLRELLRERGPMPPHAAAAVAVPVLGALAVAHRAGLVHRDIKPENILISDDGEVKIADFGLVRAVAAANTTSRSVILGTAAYLSPEQVTTGSADARSDVYSVGLLLFELLTGQTPFTGDTSLSIAYQRVDKDVPDPGSRIEGVPPEFDRLVRRATEREPGERYADAGVMGEALAALCDELDLPRYRVPAPRKSAAKSTVDPSNDTPAPPPGSSLPPGPSDADAATRVHAPVPDAGSHAVGPRPEERTAVVPQVSAAPHPTKVVTQARPRPPEETAPPATATAYLDRRRRSRRTTAVWIAVIIVLALIMGLAGWWFGSGRMTDVPVVQGLDRAAAEAALDTAGVGMEIRGIYSDDAAAETVLGTDPDGGSRVARGDTVALLVSLGAPTVPGLGGGDRASIEAELRQRTFEPVDGGTAFSSSVPEGGVAALEPAPGTTLPTGSAVSVVLSKGPAPIDMPDLVGRTVDDARKIVEDAGLTVVEVREVFDPEVDGGRVSATDPAAGTETGAGGTVTLTVSTAVKVPSFLGRSVGSARTELDRLGLDIEVRQVADTDRSLVVGQNPAPGERAEPGGTIVLTALP